MGRRGQPRAAQPGKQTCCLWFQINCSSSQAQTGQMAGAPELLQAAAAAASRGCVVVFNSPELLGAWPVHSDCREH